jgi:DNA transformation protein
MDAESIRELFAEFGPVAVRRMFSGAGIFADGVMIGLVIRGVIHLKADDQTIPAFEQEGQEPFGYATRHGERTIMSLWRIPDRLYDDPEELARWARDALAAAHRAQARARKPKSKPKRKSAK